MSDTRTPSDSPGWDTMPCHAWPNDALLEHALPTDASLDRTAREARPQREQLVEQLVEQLADLQLAYQQMHQCLETAQRELAKREDKVNRRLRAAIDLLDESVQSPPATPWSTALGARHNPGLSGTLYVHILGQFQVIHRGQRISLGSNRSGRALFRYLVTLSDRRAHKDVLAELLWPDDPPEKASHKLHIAVSSLRGALHEALANVPGTPDAILFSDDYYLLAPDLELELDTDAFLAHLAVARAAEERGDFPAAIVEYEAAQTIYRGDYMAQDLYADWAIAARAHFEEQYLVLLGQLAHHYMEQEQYAECVTCCRQILARDSFREDAYRQLMRCYSDMGRRNQALLEFHDCAQVLQQELGVAPTQATQALYERLLHQS
jgi:DNA-binding SARP family transcriptional activator